PPLRRRHRRQRFRRGDPCPHLVAGRGRPIPYRWRHPHGRRHAMKRRLLLVEDDEVFLRPLHRTLELKGYEVLPVQSGEEALDTLKSEDVDLVLTDRRLAGMDGVELVGQIKAEHPDLAVLVMTAYGTIESAVEAMRLGAEDYLVKPFETAELLHRRLDGAVGGHHQHREVR